MNVAGTCVAAVLAGEHSDEATVGGIILAEALMIFRKMNTK